MRLLLLLVCVPAGFDGRRQGSAWPVSTAVAVVAALQGHYHSGCVFLLYSETWAQIGVEDMQHLVTTGKLLAQLGIPTAAAHLENLHRVFGWNCCLRNRALHVWLRDDPDIKADMQKTLQEFNIAGPRWLLFLSAGTPEEFVENVAVPFDCEFLVAQLCSDGEVVFTEVYHMARGAQTHARVWGGWSVARGLSPSPWSFYRRRSDLNGALFKAGYVSVPSVFTVTERNGKTEVDGFFGRVWTTLQEQMNISTEYHMSKTGSWNNMIEMVTVGELDVGAGDFTITLKRAKRLQFTLPLVNTKFFVSIQRPDTSGLVWERFLTPFSTELWLAMGGCLLLVAVLMSTISWTYHRWVGRAAFWGSFLEVFGIFCQQGSSPTALLWASRLAAWAAYMGAVTLIAAYSAKIIALLAVVRTRLPFTSLQTLLDDGSYRLGMVAGSAHYSHFQEAVEPLLKQVYISLIQPHEESLPDSPYGGLARVCTDPKFAFISSFEIIPDVVDYVNCSIVFVTGASVPENLAMILPRRSPYRRIINHHLRSMHRTGVLHKLRISTWPPRRSDKTRVIVNVGLLEAAPLFSLLALGAVLALAIMGVENRRRITQYLQSLSKLKRHENTVHC